MSRTRHTPPRWVRYTLASVAAFVACALWGVTTATVDLGLGPHEARYEVTTDSTIVADLGPLGTLELDSPLPLSLGARVTVREIPSDLTAFDQAETLEALARDLDGYLQFFSGPQETVSVVARALVTDALQRTVAAMLLVVLASGGLYLLLGHGRREELAARIAPRTWEITAVVVLATLVFGSATSSSADGPSERDSRPTSPVFEDTPLAGARITGRLAGVVDTFGGQLLGLYREQQDFYREADDNLRVAWDRRAAVQRLTAAAATPEDTADGVGELGPEALGPEVPAPDDDLPGGDDQPGDGPAPDEGDDVVDQDGAPEAPGEDGAPEAPDEGGAPDGDQGGDQDGGEDADAAQRAEGEAEDGAEAEDEPQERTFRAPPDDELVTLLVVSDLHCNTGMTPLIRTVAERSGAEVILNAGDTTMNGTAVESFCVDSFASAVPSGATMVVADGNHDSQLTSAQERSAGMRVLDGRIVDVAGVRILGERDPFETRVGVGSYASGTETLADQAARLTQVACDANDGPDILLVHTPLVGATVLESGCVPVQVSGHTHRRAGPERFGLGVRYVSASTAGAAANQPTVGALRATAEMTVLRFDPVDRRVVDWQLVEVHPDASAEVSPRFAFPRPLPPPDEGETEGEPGTDGSGDTSDSGVPGGPAGEESGDVPGGIPEGEDAPDGSDEQPDGGTDDAAAPPAGPAGAARTVTAESAGGSG